MINRQKKLGIVLSLFGLGFSVASGYAYVKVQEGKNSLNAFSAAQNVKLSYNERGSWSTTARIRSREQRESKPGALLPYR